MKKSTALTLIISIPIGSVLIFCLVIFFIRAHFRNEKRKVFQDLPGIICWGDSLTLGTGGSGTSYPDELRKYIVKLEETAYSISSDEAYDFTKVINAGVGSEDAPTVVCRSDSLRIVLSEPVTIPKDTADVPISIEASDGHLINPLRNYPGNVWHVDINSDDETGKSVSGTMRVVQEYPWSGSYSYTFTRDESGEEISFNIGAEIIPDELYGEYSNYRDFFPVIFIGENGGWNDADDLIYLQKKIISRYGDGEHFLIIGLHTGTAEERGPLEEAMKAEYGDKYINLREYLTTDAVKISGVELSKDDSERIEKGMTPECFMADSIHLNAEGYKLLARAVYYGILKQY